MKKLDLNNEKTEAIKETHKILNILMWEYIDEIEELTKDELKELRFLANINFQLATEKYRRESDEKDLPFYQ